MDWHPATRHTLWALVIGGFVHWLQIAAINQNMLQRYMALPTLRAARRYTNKSDSFNTILCSSIQLEGGILCLGN